MNDFEVQKAIKMKWELMSCIRLGSSKNFAYGLQISKHSPMDGMGQFSFFHDYYRLFQCKS